jgi:hypothetical protein
LIAYINPPHSLIAEGRRFKEEAIKSRVSAIKNVLTVLAVAINFWMGMGRVYLICWWVSMISANPPLQLHKFTLRVALG